MGLKFAVGSGINFLVGLLIFGSLWVIFRSPLVYFLAYPLGVLFNFLTYTKLYNIDYSVGSLLSFLGTYVFGFIVSSITYAVSLAAGFHSLTAYFVSTVASLTIVFIWILKKKNKI